MGLTLYTFNVNPHMTSVFFSGYVSSSKALQISYEEVDNSVSHPD